MQKEKWLNNLIFDMGLFDITILSDEENITIRKYLQDQKTPDEIAQETGLSINEVRKRINTGIEKILLSSKELLAKKMWSQQILDEKEILQNELAMLRERFKKELSDEELTIKYERSKIPLINLSFSTRAHNVLYRLNIRTLNELAHLKLDTLSVARNAGPATINEIVAKALEFGITIT